MASFIQNLSQSPIENLCQDMGIKPEAFTRFVKFMAPDSLLFERKNRVITILHRFDSMRFEPVFEINSDQKISAFDGPNGEELTSLLLIMLLNPESYPYYLDDNGQNLTCISKAIRVELGLIPRSKAPKLTEVLFKLPPSFRPKPNWESISWNTWSEDFDKDVQVHERLHEMRKYFRENPFLMDEYWEDTELGFRGDEWRNQQEVWLRFDDSTLVSLTAIVDHPYYQFLDKKHRDFIVDADPEQMFRRDDRLPCESWLSEASNSQKFDEDMQQSLILVAQYFSQELSAGNLRIGLVSQSKKLKKVFWLEQIRSFDLSARDISVDADGHINTTATGSDDDSDISGGWTLDEKNKILSHDPVRGFLETLPTSSLKTINGHYQFRSSTALEIFHSWLSNYGGVLNSSKVPELTIKDFDLKFNFQKIDSASDTLSALTPICKTTVLSSQIKNDLSFIIHDLVGTGISHSSASRTIASNYDRKKRQTDLKILRHQGLNRMMTLSAFEEGGEQKLASLLCNLLKITFNEEPKNLVLGKKTFSKHLSNSVISLIKNNFVALLKILDESHPDFYFIDGKKGQYMRLNLQKVGVELARDLLEILGDVYHKDLLSKVKISSLTIEPISLCPHLKLRSLPKGDQNGLAIKSTENNSIARQALLAGAEVVIDGQVIETLDSELFDARLNLEDGKGENWFDMHPEFFFGGKLLNPEDARRFNQGGIVPYQGKHYFVDSETIPKSKWLDYFWTQLCGKGTSNLKYDEESSIVGQDPSWALNLLALKLSGLPVIGGKRWQQINANFDQLLSGKNNEIDSELPLKPFQRQGLNWLWNLYNIGLGGILADDMGLGKTIQTIAFFKKLKQQSVSSPNLIVVPTSLIHNWLNEFEKFAPDIEVETFLGRAELSKIANIPKSGSPIYLTTYGLMERYTEQLGTTEWNCIVFDEAQNLKNIRSKRTGCARKLTASSKFCLSGTPLENHYGEFYSLIDLVVPGALGNYAEFSKRYIPSRRGASGASVAAEDIKFLRHKTAPLVLRRSKDKILKELPEKTETLIKLDFEKNQKKIYRDTALSWNQNLNSLIADQGANKSQLRMLTALMRMRQICSFPQVVPTVDYAHQPPKLDRLIAMLDELADQNEPVVVFTSFRSTLQLIESALKEQGRFCLSISGDTPLKKRAEILDDFAKSKGHAVLLLTQKVGGVGLNLTNARYVFHIEPWWNPQVENQATDRVHRMGQQRAVQIYRFIMAESVEEKIDLLKARKSKDFGLLLDAEDIDEDPKDQNAYRQSRLSQKDFEYLLS